MTSKHESHTTSRRIRSPRRTFASAGPIALLIALSFGVSEGALAQFFQYSPPGGTGVATERTIEQLETSIESAPWKLGRLYARPWLGIRDVAWIDNVGGSSAGGERSDLTATVGLGLRTYLPAGNVIWATHILPEYVWWQDLEDRNRVNGRYGTGVFANLGRHHLQVLASRTESAEFFSRELEERLNTQTDELAISLELALAGGLSLDVGATTRQLRFLPEHEATLPDIASVDRDETILRGLLRYDNDLWSFGVGAESSVVDFESPSNDLSNEGVSPVLEIAYTSPRAELSVDAVWRDLEARSASLFPAYDDVTGRVALAAKPARPIKLEVYGYRTLVYSLSDAYATFQDEAVGFAVHPSFGSRASLRLFVEEGIADYFARTTATGRIDDFTSVGGRLRIQLGRVGFIISVSETDYESSLPGFDRSITIVRTGIDLGRTASSWF